MASKEEELAVTEEMKLRRKLYPGSTGKSSKGGSEGYDSGYSNSGKVKAKGKEYYFKKDKGKCKEKKWFDQGKGKNDDNRWGHWG